jgi:DNA repair protein RecN (Recombination protein N)
VLRSLHVSNYAIIDRVDLRFSKQLSIITGETGAGKSILVGALSLLLGQRADGSSLYDKSKPCILEAVFDVSSYRLQPFFAEHDLDYDAECIIRREINVHGKSRAFVNDTPVTLEVLRELSSNLVDLHHQHETLELASHAFQMDAVDAYAQHVPQVIAFQAGYDDLQALQRDLDALRNSHAEAQRELDYQIFQYNELTEANLSPGEQESLETELETLTHSEEIYASLDAARELISEGESSLSSMMNRLESALRRSARYDPRVGELLRRLESSRIEIDDVATEIYRMQQSAENDPARREVVMERLDVIFRLQKKYRVSTVDELITRRDELARQIRSIEGADESISRMELEMGAKQDELLTRAKELSSARSKAASKLEKNVTAMLPSVGLPHAVFKVELAAGEEIGPNGMNTVRFVFSANPGTVPLDIRKVASGGELSRLLLAIKSLIARSLSLPTLVFDEIDEGISGEVAKKIGSLLRGLSSMHQVICITHLPQIAAQGHAHFYVYKEVKAGRTLTFVRSLEAPERVVEIAKMLSGERPTTAALENARELLTLN